MWQPVGILMCHNDNKRLNEVITHLGSRWVDGLFILERLYIHKDRMLLIFILMKLMYKITLNLK